MIGDRRWMIGSVALGLLGEFGPVVAYPLLDVFGEPDLAHAQLNDGFGEVSAVGEDVRPLPGAAEAFLYLHGAHEVGDARSAAHVSDAMCLIRDCSSIARARDAEQ